MDLAPEKLLEEKISAEQIRDPSFWKEFYEQAQIQMQAHHRATDGSDKCKPD